MKKYILPLMVLSALTCNVQAEVLKQSTTIGAGWRETDSASEKTNQHDVPILTLNHFTITDSWDLAAIIRWENPGSVMGDVDGREPYQKVVSIFDFNKRLNKYGTSLWLQNNQAGHRANYENNTFLGLSQGFKLGSYRGRVFAGANYTFGMFKLAPTEKFFNDFNGFSGFDVKANLVGKPYENGTLVVEFEGAYNRAVGYRETWLTEKHGQHYMVALNHALTKHTVLAVKAHQYNNFGGISYNGFVMDFELGYRF